MIAKIGSESLVGHLDHIDIYSGIAKRLFAVEELNSPANVQQFENLIRVAPGYRLFELENTVVFRVFIDANVVDFFNRICLVRMHAEPDGY